MNHIRFIRFKNFSDRLLAPDIKAVVESTLKKMKMNSTVFMGVFAEDFERLLRGDTNSNSHRSRQR